jgi:hypothetical protein
VKLACVHKLVCRVQLCRLAELRRGRLAADRDALADDRRDLLVVRRDAKDICRELCRVRRDVRHRLGGRERDGLLVVRDAWKLARRDDLVRRVARAAAFREQDRWEYA